jgi:methionine-rich copper-binding protein CopC
VKGVSGLKRLTLGFLAIATSLIAGISPSSAHTSLISSQPKVDQRVSGPIMEISLQFDEDLIALGDKEPNRIALFDSDGKSIPLGKTEILGSIARASVESSTWKSGIYSVQYRVVSGDGHVVSSEYKFTYIATSANQKSSSPPENVSATRSAASLPTSTSEASGRPTQVPDTPTHEHSSFIQRHSEHAVLTFIGVALIGIWVLIRRRIN